MTRLKVKMKAISNLASGSKAKDARRKRRESQRNFMDMTTQDDLPSETTGNGVLNTQELLQTPVFEEHAVPDVPMEALDDSEEVPFQGLAALICQTRVPP